MTEKKKISPNKADSMTYEAFKTALDKKEINLYINDKVLNKPGMIVYNPWENLLPKLIPLIIGLFLLYFNIIIGLIIIIGSVAVGEKLFKKQNSSKLFERTKSYVLNSYENLEEMWEIGSIILSSSENKKKVCISPSDNWKEFIVKNFAKYMIKTEEKLEENNKEELVKDSIIKPYSRAKK